MALINVLMPVYNVECYVTEALRSILRQTFTDFEVVVVDDCSTDGTGHIVRQLASEDSRIRLVRTPRHEHLTAALNFGLTYCRAPLIARMDGDDIALAERLERQLRFLEEHPDVALVGCATRAIDQYGHPIPALGISRKPTNDNQVAKTILLASPCLHIWMARREVYDCLCGYRPIRLAEDYDFLLRALSAGYHISNLAEPLMLIRTRAGNSSSRLEQRKAHRYIARLHIERQTRGHDSFSTNGYTQAVHEGKIENAAFKLSTRFAQAGMRSRNRIQRNLYLLLSAALSPWQARYFIDRIRFRIAMRTA